MNIDNIISNFNYSERNDYNTFFLLGGKREINSPGNLLLDYQNKIKYFLENKYSFPHFITGYRKGVSIVDNAKIHLGKKFIINLDIRNFFGSIDRKKLELEFKNLTNNIDLFLDYITYKGVLPQGAPTSPIISNIIFKRIDYTINKVLKNEGLDISYSRYVDDISIGFNDYNKRYIIYDKIKNILGKEGFLLNNEKTKLFHYNKKILVTGLIISGDRVGIGYKKYRRAKKIIYYFLKFGRGYFPYIKGMLLYIKGVDYMRYEQLKNIYFNNFSLTDGYKELFGIDENGIKIEKEDNNKFNREFNYNKSKRFSKGKEFLSNDLDEGCSCDDDGIGEILDKGSDDDRYYAYL